MNRVVRTKISETGRISIPADFRKALGIGGARDVIVELAEDEIRIRTLDEIVTRAQRRARELLSAKPRASVEDFIRDRRTEAEHE